MKRWMAISAAVAALSMAAAAGAQTAPATPDPLRLELARQMFAASGGEAALQANLKLQFATIADVMSKSLPPSANHSNLGAALMGDMQGELIKLIPQLIDAGAETYAANLSERELRDYLAWLKSDSGQAIAHKAPLIQQALLRREMPMILATMPRIMEKTIDRVCAETQCTPETRQTITAAMTKALQTPHS